MKTINLLTLTVVTSSLLTLTARAGVVGSVHDFSQASWSVSTGSDPNTVCGVCHTPHHASATVGPLWGHDVNFSGTWQMYGGSSSPGAHVSAAVLNVTVPNPSSLACLSCHDGVVAINAYGDSTALNRANPQYITNSAAVSFDQGTHQNLTHSHPISFSYSQVWGQKQNEYFNPASSVLQPDSGVFNANGNSPTIAGILLDSAGNVECSSCHDVHNQVGSPYSISGNSKLLKIYGTASGTGSLLCRSCHNK